MRFKISIEGAIFEIIDGEIQGEDITDGLLRELVEDVGGRPQDGEAVLSALSQLGIKFRLLEAEETDADEGPELVY